MKRALPGPRTARARWDKGVLVAAGVVLLAACGPAAADEAAVEEPAASTAPATTAPPTTTPPPTTPPPTPKPTPVRAVVPAVGGMSATRAAARLVAVGLRVRTVARRTADVAAGTVLAVSPGPGSRLGRGTRVTLTVAEAPPPPPPPTSTAPEPGPEPAADAPSGCHPSYTGACLDPTASDYDCAGGSGNGPLYTGTVTVVGPDVFDLDRDGDGIGCE